MQTGELRKKLVGHDDSISGVDISTDGTRIVTGSSDATIRVWDASTGAQLCQLPVGANVNSVRFSPGEKRLAAAHDEGVSIWETDTERVNSDAETGQGAASRTEKVRKAYPAWHISQATSARAHENWFAATVHQARQLKISPSSRSAQLELFVAVRMLQGSLPNTVAFLPSAVCEQSCFKLPYRDSHFR